MRIQFVLGTDMENTVDIEVAEVPTEEQAKAICVAMMQYRST